MVNAKNIISKELFCISSNVSLSTEYRIMITKIIGVNAKNTLSENQRISRVITTTPI